MAQGFKVVDGCEEVRPSAIAVGSEVFAEGSPVTLDSNGFWIVTGKH